MRDESRVLAAQHVDVVHEIGQVGQEGLNTSQAALALANEALEKGEEISADLNRVLRNFNDFKDELEALKADADRVYEETAKCNENAKSITKSLESGLILVARNPEGWFYLFFP